LNEIAKAAFSVTQVTFEVCSRSRVSEAEVAPGLSAFAGTDKVQPDAIGLVGSVGAHFVFADKVADEISDEETEILKKTISKMFKVMENVAECSCDYVKRGRFGEQSAFLNFAMLRIAERTLSGLAHPHRIEEMSK